MMEREKLIALVRALQQGEESAAGELYDAFYDDIYYHILKTVDSDPELAADLTQDTFMEILETIHKLEEPAAFVTWSKQIAYHKCTAYFRKRREILLDETEDGYSAFDTVEEDRAEFIPDEALDKEDFKQTIHAMISELPEEQRSALLLRYFNEISVKEIAQIQGVTEGTVKSRLNYARKAIKQAVESYEAKSGVRIHCAGVLPLLLWFFRAYRRAQGVAITAGSATAVFAAPGAATAAAGTAAAAGKAVAKTGILGGIKAFAQTLAGKIVAGVTAVAVVAGGTAAVVTQMKQPHYELPEKWSGYSQEEWSAYHIGTLFELEIDNLREDRYEGTFRIAWPDGETYEAECQLELYSASEEFLLYELNLDVLFLRGIDGDGENKHFTSVMYLVYNVEEDAARLVSETLDGADNVVRHRVNLTRETSADSYLGAGAEKLWYWSSAGTQLCVMKTDGTYEWCSGQEYYETRLEGYRYPVEEAMIFLKYEGAEELELWYLNIMEDLDQVQIPESIDGYPVTRIGRTAMRLPEGAQSLIIPPTVRSIEANSIFTLDMKEIRIPEGVEHLGTFAFESCQAMERVILPGTLKEVDGAPFSSCLELTSIEVAPENPVYHSAGNCLIETQSGILVAGCKASVIPDDGSVTAIGRYAFMWNFRLESIRLPEGVKEIGYGAFMDCPWLERVELPVSMERIDQQAFRFCEQLTDIRYAGTVEQFRNIQGIDWEKTDLHCTVYCADGHITIG